MELKFSVKGIDCADCAEEIARKIEKKIKGVNNANISFMTEKLFVEIDDNCNTENVIEDIKKLIKKAEPDTVVEEL